MFSIKKLFINRQKELNEVELTLLNDLVNLSATWASERICPAYTPNHLSDFLNRDLFLIYKEELLIGYAMGDRKRLEQQTSYNAPGELTFACDELYIAPAYRQLGAGQVLFRFIEEDLSGQVDLISIVATSSSYRDLLAFYIDHLGLTFQHAFLTKRL